MLASRRWSFFLKRTNNRVSIGFCRTQHTISRDYATSNRIIKSLVPDGARTRFAPSPTGFPHLGSLRTALFNYLIAKKSNGQFLLRLENTDEQRTVEGAEQRLYHDLRWAGLQWDEGPDIGGPFGPYRQTERKDLYQKHAEQLVENGHAYRCFCTPERLDELSRARLSQGLPHHYDRQCAGLTREEADDRAFRGETHVIRLRVQQAFPEFDDLVYGRVGNLATTAGMSMGISVVHGELGYEDPVLLKSSGLPTYHLANVVDDHHMKITHVVRATEWLSSTPKHLALYRAFDWKPPAFAHVGLLVDEAGQKLSKRNLDTDLSHFRDIGILPSALNNFLVLLGWSHNQKSDFMDLQEMIKRFTMKFTKGNTTVTLGKLWHLQRAHAGAATQQAHGQDWQNMNERVRNCVNFTIKRLEKGGLPRELSLESFVHLLLKHDGANYTTAQAFVDRNSYLLTEPDWSASTETWNEIKFSSKRNFIMKSIISTLSESHSFPSEEKVRDAFAQAARSDTEGAYDDLDKKEKGLALRTLYKYMRWILVGGKEGPGIAATIHILGRDVCEERLKSCETMYSNRGQGPV